MITYKTITDKLTIGEAIMMYEEGTAVQVYDDKDIILVSEKKRPVLLYYR